MNRIIRYVLPTLVPTSIPPHVVLIIYYYMLYLFVNCIIRGWLIWRTPKCQGWLVNFILKLKPTPNHERSIKFSSKILYHTTTKSSLKNFGLSYSFAYKWRCCGSSSSNIVLVCFKEILVVLRSWFNWLLIFLNWYELPLSWHEIVFIIFN
jgi:hypothetical protein